MKLGIPKEVWPGERRAAATPDSTQRLIALGFEVLVERDAGASASYPDAMYEEAGATLIDGPRALWGASDVVLKVRPPTMHPGLGEHEADLLQPGATLVGFLWPGQNEELVERIRGRGASAIAMDKVPRISRAQTMDALSSMANIAGYRAVLEAAHHFGRFFCGQITAAGRVPPATVLVIGAGVAGLQAIATAKSMGAVVRAFDTREAVAEQVMSLGAEFLVVDFEEAGEGSGGYARVMSEAFIAAEMALFREQAPEVDIVVTTALIPGRPAPKLWLADMVEAMKPGSVVVDLAAEQGGNCDLTRPGEVAVAHGVTLIGHTDLTSRLPTTSSELYATNLVNLLEELGGAESWHLDDDNEIVRGCMVLRDGALTWPPEPREPAGPVTKPMAPKEAELPAVETSNADAGPAAAGPQGRGWLGWVVALALAGLWAWLKFTGAGPEAGAGATGRFLQHLTVFVLACFIGWQVIWSVTPALHTPLMSVTNAISGIIVVGGMLHATGELMSTESLLALSAVFFATINISGGFLVTQRMLRMFHR